MYGSTFSKMFVRPMCSGAHGDPANYITYFYVPPDALTKINRDIKK